MGYLFSVMWVCLGVAFVLGALMSYFWRGALYRRMTADNEQSWLSRLRQTEQDRDTRIAQLTSELEEHRVQVPTMEKSLAERSDIINALESTIESKKSSIRSLEVRLEEAVKLAADGADAKAAEAAALRHSERIAQIEQEMERHIEEANVRDQEHEALKAQLAQAEARAAEAEARLEELGDSRHEESARESKELLATTERQVADLKQELSAVNSRYARLQADHGSRESQLEAVVEKLTSVENRLEQQNVRAEDLENQLNIRSREAESSKAASGELTAAKELHEQAKSRASELEEALQTMREEASRNAQSLAQAELRRTELEQTLRSRTDKLTHEERQGVELRTRVAELESRASQDSDQRASLASELASAQSRAEDTQADFAEWKSQAERLERDLKAKEQSAIEAKAMADEWQNEHDKLKAQLANQSSLVDDARRESARLHHELAQAKSASESAQARNAEWQQRLDDKEHEAAERARDYKKQILSLEEKATQADNQKEEVAMLRRTLEQRDVEYAREHQACNEQRGQAKNWRSRYETLRAEHDEMIEAQNALRKKRVAKKPSQDSLDKPDWLLSEEPSEKDDLKKIKGVGPVMEKTMNKLGIYLYRQVAALRKKDVEWIASHINTFPGRITRDDWIGQAAELRKAKYGR